MVYSSLPKYHPVSRAMTNPINASCRNCHSSKSIRWMWLFDPLAGSSKTQVRQCLECTHKRFESCLRLNQLYRETKVRAIERVQLYSGPLTRIDIALPGGTGTPIGNPSRQPGEISSIRMGINGIVRLVHRPRDCPSGVLFVGKLRPRVPS
mmetsp:Transcript_10205/g.11674  ORF Transcript_10205/g.11674 Transcript_10205/m.11674 type:complete len:151 (-) Transcript_10205:236-688(-)